MIRIMSATYGPSKNRKFINGQYSNSDESCVPYTRDVLPFIRALLMFKIKGKSLDHFNSISLIDGKSLNEIFGDPCIGTTKQLTIHYTFSEKKINDENETDEKANGKERQIKMGQVCRKTFSEHENIILERRITHYQNEKKIKRAILRQKEANRHDGKPLKLEKKRSLDSNTITETFFEHDDYDQELVLARKMGRTQSISELEKEGTAKPDLYSILRNETSLSSSCIKQSNVIHGEDMKFGEKTSIHYEGCRTVENIEAEESITLPSSKKWRLRSYISEISLPMILPYLKFRQRVDCRLVCKVWRFVVQDWGVAQIVDVNDKSFPTFTQFFLRGIISHSYSSLHTLFLANFSDLTPQDLHPALPYLRKLKTLDVSRCNKLDNSTFILLSQTVNDSLEVLYMKGLTKVTDEGLVCICQRCHNLTVLEISNLNISDQSVLVLGNNLHKLKALFMRDNFRLTNKSIDVVTDKCTRLTQLSLWGCIKLGVSNACQNDALVNCDSQNHCNYRGAQKLVILNLWGCHGLLDASVDSMVNLLNLHTLVVNECHKLSDAFVVSVFEFLYTNKMIRCDIFVYQ